MNQNIPKLPWDDWKLASDAYDSGSYARVYTCVNKAGVKKAVKVIHIPFDESEATKLKQQGRSPDQIRTYFKEVADHCVAAAKLQMSLKHCKNVVEIEALSLVENKDDQSLDLFLRMESLTPLSTYLMEHGPLSEEEIIGIGVDIATALAAGEQKKILHRDVKVANILMRGNTALLGDYGIARTLDERTTGYSTRGTPDYMAPEVLSGNYDHRADLYSLGLVLYQLSNQNTLPFVPLGCVPGASAVREALERRFRGDPFPQPVNASPELWKVIQTATAHKPSQRYRSAAAFKSALQKITGLSADPNETLNGVSSIDFDSNEALEELFTVDFGHDDDSNSADQPADAGVKPSIASFQASKKRKSILPKVVGCATTLVLLGGCGGAFWHHYQTAVTSLEVSYVGERLFVDDALRCDQFEVTGIQRDGERVQVQEFSIDPQTVSRAGQTQVTIGTSGTEQVIELSVVALERIEAAYPDVIPFEGSIDPSQISVTGTLSDGSKLELTDFEADLSAPLQPGTNEVPVSCRGVETRMTVEMVRPEVTVLFNPKDGACEEEARTYIYGDSIGELPVPEAPGGYSFGGWTLAGEPVDTDTVVTASGELTLEANWIPHTYTLVFHNGEESYTQELTFGKESPLLPNRFVKNCCVFSGWSATSDEKDILYSDQDPVSNLTDQDGGQIDLYAIFQLDQSLLMDSLVEGETVRKYPNEKHEDFVMFGEHYDAGFTMDVGSSINIWGNGDQEAIFNVSSWAELGSTLVLTGGHIDGTDRSLCTMRIYFDEEETPTYEWEYRSEHPPFTQEICFEGHRSMRFEISNHSMTMTRFGFRFDNIY